MNSTRRLLILLAGFPIAAFCAETSPYARETNRTIKALSEIEVSRLLGGHGMGLARAAELNSYPGPRHVLDMSEELGLTANQVAQLDHVFEEMRLAALPLGRRIVDLETELDGLFVRKQASPDAVLRLTSEIGQLQGELRAVHLNAHVMTVGILTPAQVSKYDELRGYGGHATGEMTPGH